MTEPALYKHRPTVVHAIQWTPETTKAVAAFLLERWPGAYMFSRDNTHLLIETPEGDRDCNAADGYWIVEGVAHELYCVRPDIFARNYEPALATDERVPPRVQYDEQTCDAPCSHGGSCTAAVGHSGDHAAYGFDAHTPKCTWPQERA